MKNILVIKLGALGDLLANTGHIREIRLGHASDRLIFLTSPPYNKLFARCPWIDSILIDPRKSRMNPFYLLRLFRELNTTNLDMIYDLQNNQRTKMYNFFVRSQWFHGWREIESELRRLGHAFTQDVSPDLRWMVDDASQFLKENGISPGYIFLIPGSSSRHPQKRWPYYAELAEKLMSKGYSVVIAPGPDETTICQKFPCHVLYKEGRPVSMNLLAGIIGQARFVIGNDTGPTHLAAYLGIPGLALFGSHATSKSTGLDRYLDTIEVKSLKTLSVMRVSERVENILSRN